MPVIFSEAIVQLIVLFAVLAILTGVAIYVAGLFRFNSLQQEPKTTEHLDYFRELKSEGKLSESEFRIIKKQLSSRIVEEEKQATRKNGPVFKEPSADSTVLLNRGKRPDGAPWDDAASSNREDTRLAGGGDDGDSDETVEFV